MLVPGAEDTVNDGAKETPETTNQDDEQLVWSDIEVLGGGRHHDSDIIGQANDEAADKARDQSNERYSSISSLSEIAY